MLCPVETFVVLATYQEVVNLAIEGPFRWNQHAKNVLVEVSRCGFVQDKDLGCGQGVDWLWHGKVACAPAL